METMLNILGYILLILILGAIIVILPLGIIWAINYLLGFDIEYTWKSWLAVVLLSTLFGGSTITR
jgi:hypothetical protein